MPNVRKRLLRVRAGQRAAGERETVRVPWEGSVGWGGSSQGGLLVGCD